MFNSYIKNFLDNIYHNTYSTGFSKLTDKYLYFSFLNYLSRSLYNATTVRISYNSPQFKSELLYIFNNESATQLMKIVEDISINRMNSPSFFNRINIYF